MASSLWFQRVIRTGLVAGLMIGSGLVSATPASADQGHHSTRSVEVTDDCQPASFDAVLGAGACVGGGETSFSAFIAELTANKSVDDWAFDPEEVRVAAGQGLSVHSTGGEFHTFTKVAHFGGGFVPILNQLSGNPVPVPETASPFGPANLPLPPGAKATVPSNVLTPGINLFQCLIHPWMRTVVTVTMHRH